MDLGNVIIVNSVTTLFIVPIRKRVFVRNFFDCVGMWIWFLYFSDLFTTSSKITRTLKMLQSFVLFGTVSMFSALNSYQTLGLHLKDVDFQAP
mgnify:CR=1 FL=1